MSEEPKPCPFCGGKANREIGRYALRWAWCENRACRAFARAELPIDRWNTRPIEDALRKEIADLKNPRAGTCPHMEACGYEDLRAELAAKDEEISRLEKQLKMMGVALFAKLYKGDEA